MSIDFNAFKENLFAQAKQAGFSDCEIYYTNESSLTVNVFEGEVSEYKSAGEAGLSFRGRLGDKMGYAYSEKLSDEVIPFLVENARQNAGIIEDEDIEEFYPGVGPYETPALYNKALAAVTPAQKIEAALTLDKATRRADPRVESVDYCSVITQTGQLFIANTLGLNLTETANALVSYAEARAAENGQVKTGFGIHTGDSWSDFDPAAAGEKAAQKAVSLLGAKSVPTGKYRVVIKNEDMSELLQAFWSVFSAEAAQKGFSLLKGKVGTKIASEAVTLRDDALRPGWLGSAGFDGEGVPTQNKAVIENGVLKTFLHNLKTARKDAAAPTGNGFRASFKSSVGVRPTNLYLAPGDGSYDGLLAEMGDGLVIANFSGLHAGANSTSGDFSLIASGWLVEKGVPVRPVEQITVAGNFFTLLQNVVSLSDDLFMGPPSGGVFGAPSVYAGELNVSGEG
ncbi:MAG: TldD/PmbA family protein [Oscillospiraceae bacterium]|jgi:PmbA protein|nr:TldD/PmbA family protein [Oscillospiraceae bacterium]